MPASFRNPSDVHFYHQQVWDLVRQIPGGKVATYGQIAGMIPPPDQSSFERYRAFGPRWVGGAMAACPDDVPWHRVINSEGKISTRRFGGESTQRQLLEDEGIIFDHRQRVDLKRFGWQGPAAVIQKE